ncbi:MAG TPA: hypothetical protein VKQ06_09920, partial [Gammaproteobacteria bacterium]|nr:hypothetical protein [Gammaproteobacteria bacterium]
MRGSRTFAAGIAVIAGVLIFATGRGQELAFIPSTAAHGYAVRAYESIWDEHGEDIVAALEARTCLQFPEVSVSAIVADAVSNSGGPEHPMRLRASYAPEIKRSTLVHELGHRHLWQLSERLEEIDGHETLYLFLDLVWADVWGEEFAENRIRDESGWQANYDYAAAWNWARSLAPEERDRLWGDLLAMNGFAE